MKQKVSLTPQMSTGYGHLLNCCGKRQPVHIDNMEDGDVWECVKCQKPLMLKHEGQHYMIGQNITI